MELVHCSLCRQDRVEVVALPLHSMLVEVAAVLHRNELLAQENRDTVNHGVSCQVCRSSNGIATGMAGVRPALLNQQQISIGHERGGWKVQQKNLMKI